MHSLPFCCRKLTNTVHQPETFLCAKMCLKYPARIFGLRSSHLLLLPFFLSPPNSSPLRCGGFPFHSCAPWAHSVSYSYLPQPRVPLSALNAVSLFL